jgi:hypothetical protein
MATGHVRAVRDELVPAVRAGAALLADASGEHGEEEQRACNGPPPRLPADWQHARCVRRVDHWPSTRSWRPARLLERDAALSCREFEGVLRVVIGQGCLNASKSSRSSSDASSPDRSASSPSGARTPSRRCQCAADRTRWQAAGLLRCPATLPPTRRPSPRCWTGVDRWR